MQAYINTHKLIKK